MTSIRFLLLQAVLFVTLVYGRSTRPQQQTFYVSKERVQGLTAHRITVGRLRADSRWDQISGENKENGEMSYFKAYDREYERSWLHDIGGFEKKMYVCKMVHQNDDEMFLLVAQRCDRYATSIHEEFSFYVAEEDLDEYSLNKIYYASCQDSSSRFAYTQISRHRVTCTQGRLEEGHFYAPIPEVYACDYLHAPDGTTISYQYNHGRISGARVHCIPGYQISGSAYLSCGTSGRWSSPNSRCEPVECGNPRLQDPRMRVTTPGPYNYGDWVSFTCERGYELFPREASANCQGNGEWFYQNAECKLIDCKYPGEPRFGSTISDEGYQLGATITYQCNRGYRRDGPDIASCTDTGRWEPAELPTCREVRCPRLPQPENGRHHGSDSRFVMGQEVIFQCDSGYSLVGEQILECKFDEQSQTGVWSAEVPECSQVRCQPPRAPENGDIMGSDYSYGAQISFQCDVGYTMRGSNAATCLSNGQWDSQPPKCHVMQCRDPGTPEHATRNGNSFTYMSLITYRCNVGYTRFGSETIVCTENGKWSSKPPTCQPVGCDEMSAPQSGSKEVVTLSGSQDEDSYVYGTKVQFSCFPGYQLSGANETECLSNGKWSEEQPDCEPCGYRYYKEEAGTGTCRECPVRSYTTSEASTSRRQCICEADTHGPAGGPCEAIRCTYPADPEHGEVKECGTENNDICTFSCEPGYILQGSRTRTCTPQGWTGHLPVCVACPANMYKRDEGSLSCTPCPQNTHIAEGSLGVGQDSCVCLPGFRKGRSGDCEDIDECAVNKGGCEDECNNTPGSYTCKCTTGGYELNEDGHTCDQTNTCSDLQERPRNGFLNCKRYDQTNGVTCWIRCNAGYFFVSGLNDYVTCGPGTEFEWSHKIVNKTNVIPSCTEEFFVDVLLPIKATYESQFSCNSLEFSAEMIFEKMRVQRFISTLHQCIDTSASGKFCEATNLSVSCKDMTGDSGEIKSEITVGFDVLLKNKEEGALHPSCEGPCQRENLRGILGNAVNLTKELEQLLTDKSIGIDTGSGNPTPVVNTGLERVRPQLLCVESGRVLTDKRLCVPCDKGYFLANRTDDTCTPCPAGTYQNELSATSCKPCLSGSTTLTVGTPSPHMCNVMVTEILVNTTRTQTELNMGGDGDEDVDLDTFGLAF